MLFNSLNFFLLLALTGLAYWCTPAVRWRQNALLCASLIFYAYWFAPYLPLLLALTTLAYGAGGWVAAGSRRILALAVAALLLILGLFKYLPFVHALLARALSPLRLPPEGMPSSDEWSIVAPLGISFICFQLIAYLVDVARHKIPAERDWRLFTLFIAFFPQLVAGPICRADQLIPQLKARQPFDLNRVSGGALLVIVGLFLKVGFADGLAPFVDSVFEADSAGSEPALLAAACFGIQIFCDFWGYSTMAVGAARLFGIEVPINFYLPYLATSLREFWRRWHITLSSWFRDYLYIPLGGSRRSEARTALNLILVMTLCGLWHGANLTFVLWGLLHGLYLAAERWVKVTLEQKKTDPTKTDPTKTDPTKMHLKEFAKSWLRHPSWLRYGLSDLIKPLGEVMRWGLTLAFVTTTWIFFRAQGLEQAWQFTQAAWLGSSLWQAGSMLQETLVMMLWVALAHIPSDRWVRALSHRQWGRAGWWAGAMGLELVALFLSRQQLLSQTLESVSLGWLVPQLNGLAAVPQSLWRLLFIFAIAHIPLQRLIDSILNHQLRLSWRLVLLGWLALFAIILSSGESLTFIYFEF